MKLANYDGRAAIVCGDSVADVHEVSGGRFGPDPMRVFDDWPAFAAFARDVTNGTVALEKEKLRCPVPEPRQVFAIGLNYRTHAEESGMAIPTVPATFTKFPASLAGPFDDVEAPDAASASTVAVQIRGHSLGALFDNWLVFYDDVRDPPGDDMIGRMCVCGLADGRVLVKALKRSQVSGMWTLLSNTEPPIYDVALDWAALVREMRPR